MKMMRWVTTIPLRVRTLFRKRRVERELDEELQFDLDRQVEAMMAEGLSPVEARRVAMKSLGGVERQMERCRDVRAWRVAGFAGGGCGVWVETVVKRKVTSGARGAVASAGDWGLCFGVSADRCDVVAAFAGCDPERLYGVRFSGFFFNGSPRSGVLRFVGSGVSADAGCGEGPGGADCGCSRTASDVTYGSDQEMERARRRMSRVGYFRVFGLRPVLGGC